MATSITLVSLSKFMSHTCEAISERGSTSPWRRISSSSRPNSLAVRSMRLPARLTRRRSKSSSRSATCRLVGSVPVRPRRRMVRTRASSSANENGFTR